MYASVLQYKTYLSILILKKSVIKGGYVNSLIKIIMNVFIHNGNGVGHWTFICKPFSFCANGILMF
jgi:hypothetical protein